MRNRLKEVLTLIAIGMIRAAKFEAGGGVHIASFYGM